LAFKLFGTDESDDDDDGEEDTDDDTGAAPGAAIDAQAAHKIQVTALKSTMEDTWKDVNIIWDNKDPTRAFREEAPLEGFQTLCGPNASLVVKQVRASKIGDYLICYDLEVLKGAVNHMSVLTRLWKSFKSPGRKMDLVTKTFALELTHNGSHNRKPLMLLVAVLLEAKRVGHAVVDPDVASL
jgi:hypothetical protein